jgi:hypothetical protein
MNMLAFPMLAGGKRERERGGGESVHPSTPALGLLRGISYAAWWTVRERKGEIDSYP